jgi:hypothetical protein
MGEWVGLKLQFETDGWVGLLLSFLFLARFSVMEEGGEWWSPHAVGGVGGHVTLVTKVGVELVWFPTHRCVHATCDTAHGTIRSRAYV